jgi:hypothetical protein
MEHARIATTLKRIILDGSGTLSATTAAGIDCRPLNPYA